jgi:phosphoglycolate phosphatase
MPFKNTVGSFGQLRPHPGSDRKLAAPTATFSCWLAPQPSCSAHRLMPGISPSRSLESTLPRNRTVTLIQSALTKTLDLKSIRISTYKKNGGREPPTRAMPSDQCQFDNVRLLAFDLDGTLIDSKLDLALSVNATLERMGREPLSQERIFGYVGQGAPRLIEQALGRATPEECQEGLEHFLAYYREHMLDNTVTYPGVREGLEALKGIPMAVLTNKPVRFSQQIIEGLGLARFFRVVYGGNSFETKKPDPQGMNVLLRDFGAAPRDAMLVGDSEVDVQTARNAGTWCCCVTYGLGRERLAEYPPDLLVDSLTELAGRLEAQPDNLRRR